MRIICVDRALGNQAWVQVYARGVNTTLHVKLIHQPQGVQAIACDKYDNQVRVMNCGIERVVRTWIAHFMPELRREANSARMEWEY